MLSCEAMVFLCSLILIPLRICIQLFFIDPFTGFYTGSSILFWLYPLLMALAFFLFFWTQPSVVRPGALFHRKKLLLLPSLLMAFSAGVSAVEIWAQIQLPPENPSVSHLHLLGWLVCFLSALGSSLLFLFLAFSSHLGQSKTTHPLFLLFPVVWAMQLLIQRFSQFTSLSHISDQKYFIAFLCLSSLFLLAHARIIGQVDSRRAQRWIKPLGYMVFLLGASLACGQAAVWMVHEVFPSSVSTADSLLIASLSLYALVYSYTVDTRPILVEPSR